MMELVDWRSAWKEEFLRRKNPLMVAFLRCSLWNLGEMIKPHEALPSSSWISRVSQMISAGTTYGINRR